MLAIVVLGSIDRNYLLKINGLKFDAIFDELDFGGAKTNCQTANLNFTTNLYHKQVLYNCTLITVL